MTWPLIERELRAALRKHELPKMRAWGTMICAAFTALYLLVNFASSTRDWGKSLSSLLFWGGLILILQVPKYTVGIFADERRNQTLGLLFLCGIGPGELFLSKTLGSALVSFSRLLILYPFFAISFFGGGVSLDAFVATIVSLPVLMLFVFSVCVLASVLCQEESTAMFVAILIGVSLCFGPSLIYTLADFWADPNSSTFTVQMFSPSQPAFLAATNLGGATIGDFWFATSISVGWSLLILFIAGFVLNRVWQDKPENATTGTFLAKLDERFQSKAHGDVTSRKKLSLRWHDTNPYVWLATRDRWPVTLAWIVIVTVMLLWLGACVVWPDGWMHPASFFLTAIVLNYALGWVSIFAAVKIIGDNRRSGALELLLTTPLNHLDIIRGQMVALREQFRSVARAVLILEIVMLAVGLAAREWTTESLVIYLIIWSALIAWTTRFMRSFRHTLPLFWDSLVCGRPAYVALRKFGFITSPVRIAYFLVIVLPVVRSILSGGMKHFPSGSFGEFFMCGIVLIVLVFIRGTRMVLRHNVESQIAMDFRAIAAKPVPEPSDPRYKYWKSGEHFPEMFSDVLVNRIFQHMKTEKTKTGTGR